MPNTIETDLSGVGSAPTFEDLLDAIEQALGPATCHRLDCEALLQRARLDAEADAVRQWNAARSFTGKRYDAARPPKETARLIAQDLQQAVREGRIPQDRYRVTVRKRRWGAAPFELCIWTWHGRAHWDQLRAIANAYDKLVSDSKPMDNYNNDRWHFRVTFERPSVLSHAETRAAWQAIRRGELTLDEHWARMRPRVGAQYEWDTGLRYEPDS